jgi:hypothetical protein
MTIIFLKSYALTYSRRAVIIALQTSGINLEMDALNILNKYVKLPSESSVARYLNITTNLYQLQEQPVENMCSSEK